MAINHQYGPYPAELAALIAETEFMPGWEFSLTSENYERDHSDVHGASAGGLTLIIFADVNDTYHPQLHRPVNHLFEVPTATYNREAWQRWLFERIRDVVTHEACEWFKVGGIRPFAPIHAPGHDPYSIVQLTTDEARRTSFRGKLKEDPEDDDGWRDEEFPLDTMRRADGYDFITPEPDVFRKH